MGGGARRRARSDRRRTRLRRAGGHRRGSEDPLRCFRAGRGPRRTATGRCPVVTHPIEHTPLPRMPGAPAEARGVHVRRRTRIPTAPGVRRPSSCAGGRDRRKRPDPRRTAVGIQARDERRGPRSDRRDRRRLTTTRRPESDMAFYRILLRATRLPRRLRLLPGRSTRRAARNTRLSLTPKTATGTLRSRSTSTWSRPPVPAASILLVEANSNSLANLTTAENTAASLGASTISNSWAIRPLRRTPGVRTRLRTSRHRHRRGERRLAVRKPRARRRERSRPATRPRPHT